VKLQEAVSDIGIGAIGGYVGTQVMERVSMKLYEMEPEEARQKEDEVRPGPPFVIAARKTADLLGLDLSEEQIQTLATYVFHYGLGMGWGPMYTFLRRWTNLNPVSAGLLTGAAMSLVVDEGMTPLLGFSAPNRDYPLVTHLRGFAAHLAFRLGVAGTAETIHWLGRNAGRG
jgi:hypothetical protein